MKKTDLLLNNIRKKLIKKSIPLKWQPRNYKTTAITTI